jgi:hypothetical protein
LCSKVQQEGHVFAICSLALESDDAETAAIDSGVLIAYSTSSDFLFFGFGDEKKIRYIINFIKI